MSILTSSYDPLNNQKLIVGAIDSDGNTIFNDNIMCVDWYNICPELYYEKSLPDSVKSVTLDDPVNYTYLLLIVSDTYGSLYDIPNAQGIMSLQRWRLYEQNNTEIQATFFKSSQQLPDEQHLGAQYLFIGDPVPQYLYPGFNPDNPHDEEISYTPKQWATLDEYGISFDLEHGRRPGDPANGCAWAICKVPRRSTFIPKYSLTLDWELGTEHGRQDRYGRIPATWKIYQTTNSDIPEWKLIDLHYRDGCMLSHESSKSWSFDCNRLS